MKFKFDVGTEVGLEHDMGYDNNVHNTLVAAHMSLQRMETKIIKSSFKAMCFILRALVKAAYPVKTFLFKMILTLFHDT
jgi:hypothetical protein